MGNAVSTLKDENDNENLMYIIFIFILYIITLYQKKKNTFFNILNIKIKLSQRR